MARAITVNLEDAATEIFESLVKHKALAKETALAISVRVQYDHYGRSNKSVCKLLKVIYFSPLNYTKVMWRESEFTQFGWEGEYTLIANHDSCWREAWEPVNSRKEAIRREFLLSLPKAVQKREVERNGSEIHDHITIDKVELIPINRQDGETFEYRMGIDLRKVDADKFEFHMGTPAGGR